MNTKLKGLKAQESLLFATLKYDKVGNGKKLREVQQKIVKEEKVYGSQEDQDLDRWKESK